MHHFDLSLNSSQDIEPLHFTSINMSAVYCKPSSNGARNDGTSMNAGMNMVNKSKPSIRLLPKGLNGILMLSQQHRFGFELFADNLIPDSFHLLRTDTRR